MAMISETRDKVEYSNEQEIGCEAVNITEPTYNFNHWWVLVVEMSKSVVKKFKN
jgi:hypothetical protein